MPFAVSVCALMSGLDDLFENPKCELEYKTPFELLVAVVLSAQCTDKRVNQVTRELFKTHNTPQDFAEIPLLLLQEKIHSCGFYQTKAKAIKSASIDIINKFGGKVPDNLPDLTTLAGVGRKTANVVLSEIFGKQAIAVDTHVLRVSNRLRFANSKNPNIVEKQLQKVFPQQHWSKMHHQLVLFGRYICKSQKPQCEKCPFALQCGHSRLIVGKK